MVKNLSVNAGNVRDVGLDPELGRSPGVGNGNPLQYSCLENFMNRRAWWATVHGATKSRTPLKRLSRHTHTLRRYKTGLKTKNHGQRRQTVKASRARNWGGFLEEVAFELDLKNSWHLDN